jgi:hypothetical protein
VQENDLERVFALAINTRSPRPLVPSSTPADIGDESPIVTARESAALREYSPQNGN